MHTRTHKHALTQGSEVELGDMQASSVETSANTANDVSKKPLVDY